MNQARLNGTMSELQRPPSYLPAPGAQLPSPARIASLALSLCMVQFGLGAGCISGIVPPPNLTCIQCSVNVCKPLLHAARERAFAPAEFATTRACLAHEYSFLSHLLWEHPPAALTCKYISYRSALPGTVAEESQRPHAKLCGAGDTAATAATAGLSSCCFRGWYSTLALNVTHHRFLVAGSAHRNLAVCLGYHSLGPALWRTVPQ